MIYHGAQFRAARAVLLLRTRDIARGAAMSMATLNSIEREGPIKFGEDEAPRGDEAAVMRLVSFYEERGIKFSPATADGPGVRFTADVRRR